MTIQSAIGNFFAQFFPADPIILGIIILFIVAIAMFSLRFTGGEALIVMFLFVIGLSDLLGGVFGNIKAFALVLAALLIGYFIWTKMANG